MPKILGTTYMEFSPENDNTLAMLEIWEAPYFVPLKGGKAWQGFKRVDLENFTNY